MIEPKPKRTVRRAPPKKAANSDIPMAPMSQMGPTCGHDGCGPTCRVRYIGPTSPMRDQHIIHAARGVAHVWTAAIVSGLAVVLTGAFAFTAVQAAAPAKADTATNTIAYQLGQINLRLNSIDGKLNQLLNNAPMPMMDGGSTSSRPLPPSKSDAQKGPPPAAAPTDGSHSCMESCTKTTLGCLKTAGTDATARQTCMTTDTTCRTSCAQAAPAPSAGTAPSQP